jgi:cation:H+ antiporter
MVVLELLAAVVLIVAGAIVFTNAVEWLGVRLNLGQGAVGSLLAAVGTALPESMIPIVAVLRGGGEETVQIAIGAIIGAPFLLGTLAMLLVACSALLFRRRRGQGAEVAVDDAATRRDLTCFLALFPVGIAAGVMATSASAQLAVAGLLVAGYGLYTWRSVHGAGDAEGGEEELRPLHFDWTKHDPPHTAQIVVQFAVSLAAIIGGAELFVGAIEAIASSLGVSALVLALVLAPLATELPEKFNSVIWMRQGKDVLAVGNITGAMAFQATIPVAFGLAATPWELDGYAVAAAAIGWTGGAIALWALPRHRLGAAPSLAWAALFASFVLYAVLE